MMPKLLAAMEFRSNNGTHRPLLDALDAIRRAEGKGQQFSSADEVAIEGVKGTTACASDSKHFSAFDQNLMTEWHVRYGGRGVTG